MNSFFGSAAVVAATTVIGTLAGFMLGFGMALLMGMSTADRAGAADIAAGGSIVGVSVVLPLITVAGAVIGLLWGLFRNRRRRRRPKPGRASYYIATDPALHQEDR